MTEFRKATTCDAEAVERLYTAVRGTYEGWGHHYHACDRLLEE